MDSTGWVVPGFRDHRQSRGLVSRRFRWRSKVSSAITFTVAPTGEVRRARPEDQDAVVRTLDLAFADDPFVGWLVGSKPRSAEARRRYFEMVFRRLTLPHGGAFVTDDASAVALWAPPRSWDLELWGSIAILPDVAAVIGWHRLFKVARALEPVERSRPPQPWYLLALLGTDPNHQGFGLGSKLLIHQLKHCDKDGVPAVLDTCVKGNVGFYQRHGFEVVNETRLENGPTCWSMLREGTQP